MTRYTNLVFEGGGVKGIAYAGALETLNEMQVLPGIRRVAGTSAGAITATLVSLGYTPAEIREHIFNLDFKSLEDRWDPLRLASEYGLYDGHAFLTWIQDMIAAKATAGKNATFEDLHKQDMLDLYVYATDLNLFNLKQFSYSDTPAVVVSEAVRASISIPLFFKAWRFSNDVPDHHLYVDGGVVLNYPITAFDTVTMPDDPQTLGLYLYDFNSLKKPSTLGYGEPVSFCRTVFETLLSSQDIDFRMNPSMENRTVKIDDFGILATDFAISDEQKEALFLSGKNAVLTFLEKQHYHI